VEDIAVAGQTVVLVEKPGAVADSDPAALGLVGVQEIPS